MSESPVVSTVVSNLTVTIRAVLLVILGPVLPLLEMAAFNLRRARVELERAEGPSSMAKAILIALAGFAIIAAALFLALRQSANKIQQQMNADY